MQAIAVLSTPTQLADAGNRDFLHIYNNGAETIFIGYDDNSSDGSSLTVDNGFPVKAGTWYNLDNDGQRNLFSKRVWAIAAGGPVDVRIQGA